jgi:hypothetical protein
MAESIVSCQDVTVSLPTLDESIPRPNLEAVLRDTVGCEFTLNLPFPETVQLLPGINDVNVTYDSVSIGPSFCQLRVTVVSETPPDLSCISPFDSFDGYIVINATANTSHGFLNCLLLDANGRATSFTEACAPIAGTPSGFVGPVILSQVTRSCMPPGSPHIYIYTHAHTSHTTRAHTHHTHAHCSHSVADAKFVDTAALGVHCHHLRGS